MSKIGETSHKETAFGIIPRSKLIPLEIEGIKRAWDFAIEKFSSRHSEISSDFLCQAHKIGFGWIFPEFGGKFRKIDVKVSEHTPPKFYLVPQLTKDFTADLDVRLKNLPKISNKFFLDELISLLAWSHHRFLWIHPFADYNGRIGRLLNNVILLKLNLPPIELKVETKIGRMKYVKALKEADAGDFKNLERLFREALEESLAEIKKAPIKDKS